MINLKRILIISLIVPASLLHAQGEEQIFRIKYLSAENVYLDSGSVEGLVVGDHLIVQKNGQTIADIEVMYVAEHSASCKIVSQLSNLEQGDVATFTGKKLAEKKVEEKEMNQKSELLTQVMQITQQPVARIRGNVSIQWNHFTDLSTSKLDFDQPTLRLNLKELKLWGKEFNFRLKMRARYNNRTRSFNFDVPEDEWRNRIYELSFSYDNEQALFNYKIGRIISNKFSGVGYIDGVLVQYNYSPTTKLGVFAGAQPEWHYSNFQTSLQKYGTYFNYLRGDYRSNRFETTLAIAGEYHGATVSREFIYIQNNYSRKNRWSIYQSAELDINRGWKKEKTGENISLTNLYVYGSYKFNDSVSLGLSYDNRKNYFTYEVRTLADSLFDDALRQGLRANVNLRMPGDYRVYTSFGIRGRERESQYTYSFAGGISKANFLENQLFLDLQVSGFSNPFTKGLNPSMRVSKNIGNGHNLGVSYGNYVYILKADDSRRINQWLRINGQVELTAGFYFSGQYEYGWGDDLQGHRTVAELGYRF